MLGIVSIVKWPESAEPICTLPGEWHDRLRVDGSRRDRVLLRAGNRAIYAHAIFTNDEQVQMTDALRLKLLLPLGPICAKAVDGEVQFGPFVGLYALPGKESGKPFGELTAVFQDMTLLAQQEGVNLFVFTPGDADWEKGVTYAHAYKPQQQKWVRTRRPLPDIVLNKVMIITPDWRERIRRDHEAFRERVPYGAISRALGDKWEAHRTLVQHEELHPLLPDTRLIRTPQDVTEMLEQHGAVFVKPALGTQGKGIYRLHMEGERIRVRFTQGGKTFVKQFKSGGTKGPLFIKRKFCARRRFLVQEALDLLKVAGVRPVDFRWLVQKDGRGEWQVTARVARVGTPSAITTNLHTGGDAYLADDLLKQHGYRNANDRRDLLRRMDEGALAIARALDQTSGQQSELGIDFGLTKQGRFYLIEVNPRPGRQMLKQTAPDTRALSLRRNLEYAKYTTGFQAPT